MQRSSQQLSHSSQQLSPSQQRFGEKEKYQRKNIFFSDQIAPRADCRVRVAPRAKCSSYLHPLDLERVRVFRPTTTSFILTHLSVLDNKFVSEQRKSIELQHRRRGALVSRTSELFGESEATRSYARRHPSPTSTKNKPQSIHDGESSDVYDKGLTNAGDVRK